MGCLPSIELFSLGFYLGCLFCKASLILGVVRHELAGIVCFVIFGVGGFVHLEEFDLKGIVGDLGVCLRVGCKGIVLSCFVCRFYVYDFVRGLQFLVSIILIACFGLFRFIVLCKRLLLMVVLGLFDFGRLVLYIVLITMGCWFGFTVDCL